MSKRECIIRLIVGAIVCIATLALIWALDSCGQEIPLGDFSHDSVQYVIRLHDVSDSLVTAMFIQPFFKVPKFASPEPLMVPVPVDVGDGFVQMEDRDLNDVVNDIQMRSVPTDIDMCKKLGVNLEQVNVSLNPTDPFTQQEMFEDAVLNAPTAEFNKIFDIPEPQFNESVNNVEPNKKLENE